MKRIFLFAALLTAAVAETFACTNLIVGKNASTDDILYLTYSNYTNPTASFFTYNIKTGKMDEASFLKDIPEKLKTSTIYMLEVNDNNGDFYIGTSEYTTNGTIYRFKKDGTFIEQFDAGGMNPNSAIFFN